jgi:preprotein translocase subunit SecA
MHHLYAALRANHLYHRDQHYVVQAGEIVIVDEFTGRLMTGRRWSDGLHQAVEAKEGVAIQAENQTLASITFQNYFRLYGKLAGMTGTADTEAYEFQEIYGLETVVIPHNRPASATTSSTGSTRRRARSTRPRSRTSASATSAASRCWWAPPRSRTPRSSRQLLDKENLPHQVLNAKQHAREADIVAQAGRPKMITIATNMAGRGTDIVLGGNIEKMVQAIEATRRSTKPRVQAQIAELRAQWQRDHERSRLGGLRIIATERHESRRIDNQLRGRSGRQGDPGSSRFYLSLDDSLMRIFAGDRVRAIMDRLKMPDGEAIEAGIVTRSIESAQRKVEARNFDMRKQLLEYDDVSNDQRKVIYQQRNGILDAGGPERADRILREGCFTTWCASTCRRSRSRSSGTSRPAKSTAGQGMADLADLKARSSGQRPSPTRTSRQGGTGRQCRQFDAKVALVGSRTSRSSSAWCCCRASTPTGASTSVRWTTCARASTCAATPRSSPSRNTSARPSSCLASCWTPSKTRSPKLLMTVQDPVQRAA